MANSFPSPPADMQLASLGYLAILPSVTIQAGSSLDYGAGVSGQLVYSVPNLGATFTFTTPGSFGTFDQTAFETALADSVTTVIGVLAAMSGTAEATLQGQVEIQRNWTWTNGSSYQLAWQDKMTYP